MNEETAVLLSQLAERFGTTTEYLWAALLRQAGLTGVVNASIFLVWLSVGIVLCGIAWDGAKWKNKDDMYCARAATIGYLVATLAIANMAVPSIAAALFNPEYWALMQVLGK